MFSHLVTKVMSITVQDCLTVTIWLDFPQPRTSKRPLGLPWLRICKTRWSLFRQKKVNFHREQQRPTHPHWYTADSLIIRLAWLRYLPQIFFLSCFQNLYFLSFKTERSVYIKTEAFLESFWRSLNQYKLFTSEPLDDWNDSNVSSRKTLNAESAKTAENERVSQLGNTTLEIINCSLGKNRIVSA